MLRCCWIGFETDSFGLKWRVTGMCLCLCWRHSRFCKMVSWIVRIHPWLGDWILDLYLWMEAAGIVFDQQLRAMQLQLDCIVGDWRLQGVAHRLLRLWLGEGGAARPPGPIMELLSVVGMKPGLRTGPLVHWGIPAAVFCLWILGCWRRCLISGLWAFGHLQSWVCSEIGCVLLGEGQSPWWCCTGCNPGSRVQQFHWLLVVGCCCVGWLVLLRRCWL